MLLASGFSRTAVLYLDSSHPQNKKSLETTDILMPETEQRRQSHPASAVQRHALRQLLCLRQCCGAFTKGGGEACCRQPRYLSARGLSSSSGSSAAAWDLMSASARNENEDFTSQSCPAAPAGLNSQLYTCPVDVTTMMVLGSGEKEQMVCPSPSGSRNFAKLHSELK